MRQISKTLNITSEKQFQLINVTDQVKEFVSVSGMTSGILTIFCPHTTASVRLNHDEPLLAQDIMKAVYRLAPVDINYAHDLFEVRQEVAVNERSNGHAHVKTFFFGSSETLIIQDSELILGEKQSIFFVEFDGDRERKLHLTIIGE